MKKVLILCVASILMLTPVFPDEGALLQRIVALEQRIVELEQKLSPVLEAERIKLVADQQRERAKERMLLDADFYPRAVLGGIEKKYQLAMDAWKSDDCKTAMKDIIKRFPLSNRAGCSVMNLALMSEGSEQLNYLEDAMGLFGGCYFESGVQVGAYARLYLAMRYKKDGKEKKAKQLFTELKTLFPDAIDHQGKPLSEHYEGMDE